MTEMNKLFHHCFIVILIHLYLIIYCSYHQKEKLATEKRREEKSERVTSRHSVLIFVPRNEKKKSKSRKKKDGANRHHIFSIISPMQCIHTCASIILHPRQLQPVKPARSSSPSSTSSITYIHLPFPLLLKQNPCPQQ